MGSRSVEREIEPGDPGTIRPKGTPASSYDDQSQYESKMGEIIGLIDNKEFTDLGEINRLIALEIAITLGGSIETYKVRNVNDKIKSLRELARTLSEGDQLTKKDFLNFDGPKFRFVLAELMSLFRQSLKSGGMAEDSTNHVLRIFRDLLQMRAPELRKETDRVNADSMLPELLTAPTTEVQPTPKDAQ